MITPSRGHRAAIRRIAAKGSPHIDDDRPPWSLVEAGWAELDTASGYFHLTPAAREWLAGAVPGRPVGRRTQIYVGVDAATLTRLADLASVEDRPLASVARDAIVAGLTSWEAGHGDR